MSSEEFSEKLILSSLDEIGKTFEEMNGEELGNIIKMICKTERGSIACSTVCMHIKGTTIGARLLLSDDPLIQFILEVLLEVLKRPDDTISDILFYSGINGNEKVLSVLSRDTLNNIYELEKGLAMSAEITLKELLLLSSDKIDDSLAKITAEGLGNLFNEVCKTKEGETALLMVYTYIFRTRCGNILELLDDSLVKVVYKMLSKVLRCSEDDIIVILFKSRVCAAKIILSVLSPDIIENINKKLLLMSRGENEYKTIS